jgi:hypothetical protein
MKFDFTYGDAVIPYLSRLSVGRIPPLFTVVPLFRGSTFSEPLHPCGQEVEGRVILQREAEFIEGKEGQISLGKSPSTGAD